VKPFYRLVSANPHSLMFRDVNFTGVGVTSYLMPRWRWAAMCKGRWS
jgi:hypothetical protein